MSIVYGHASRFLLLHDQFTHNLAEVSQYHFIYKLSHAAIRVQFLRNKSTFDEGNSMTSLIIRLLLTPADATLLFNITIKLSVSSGSATGTVHG